MTPFVTDDGNGVDFVLTSKWMLAFVQQKAWLAAFSRASGRLAWNVTLPVDVGRVNAIDGGDDDKLFIGQLTGLALFSLASRRIVGGVFVVNPSALQNNVVFVTRRLSTNALRVAFVWPTSLRATSYLISTIDVDIGRGFPSNVDLFARLRNTTTTIPLALNTNAAAQLMLTTRNDTIACSPWSSFLYCQAYDASGKYLWTTPLLPPGLPQRGRWILTDTALCSCVTNDNFVSNTVCFDARSGNVTWLPRIDDGPVSLVMTNRDDVGECRDYSCTFTRRS